MARPYLIQQSVALLVLCKVRQRQPQGHIKHSFPCPDILQAHNPALPVDAVIECNLAPVSTNPCHACTSSAQKHALRGALQTGVHLCKEAPALAHKHWHHTRHHSTQRPSLMPARFP